MVNRMQKRVIEIADGRLVRDAHRALYSDLDNNLLDLAGGRQALDETFGSEELFAEMAAIRNGEASPSQPAEEAGAAEKERRGFTSYDFYYKRR